MERLELENWLIHHPGLVHSDLSVLLDECEKEARDHARRDAWAQAKKMIGGTKFDTIIEFPSPPP